MPWNMLKLSAVILACGALLPVWGENVTNRFGFGGPEIFPIENQIAQIKCADIDGDALNDLVLLAERAKREINELPPDARFRIQSIASEKRISSLVVADLNSDKRPDLAYYGEPKELIVQYNEGTNKWSTLKRFPLEDGTLDPYALVNGDLNG